jgi:hypothetical protein
MASGAGYGQDCGVSGDLLQRDAAGCQPRLLRSQQLGKHHQLLPLLRLRIPPRSHTRQRYPVWIIVSNKCSRLARPPCEHDLLLRIAHDLDQAAVKRRSSHSLERSGQRFSHDHPLCSSATASHPVTRCSARRPGSLTQIQQIQT